MHILEFFLFPLIPIFFFYLSEIVTFVRFRDIIGEMSRKRPVFTCLCFQSNRVNQTCPKSDRRLNPFCGIMLSCAISNMSFAIVVLVRTLYFLNVHVPIPVSSQGIAVGYLLASAAWLVVAGAVSIQNLRALWNVLVGNVLMGGSVAILFIILEIGWESVQDLLPIPTYLVQLTSFPIFSFVLIILASCAFAGYWFFKTI